MDLNRFTIPSILALFTSVNACCGAFASPVHPQENFAQDAVASVADYVNRFGSNGALVNIDPVTGALSENQFIGTTTDLRICQELILAHTNFSSGSGEEVTGNFIIDKSAGNLNVSYYSFGTDESLRRIETPSCQTLTLGDAKLRLVPFTN